MGIKLTKNEFSFFPLFERFISDSLKGKRLQPNGKRLKEGTVINYGYTLLLLEDFCQIKNFSLRIRRIRYLTTRQLETEKNYWKKFYSRFTDYLYTECKHYDNYVGQTIKNVKAFFNYLNKDLALGVGEFHKFFYVRKEEIAIFPLTPEELNFLIGNEQFENSLTKRMKEVKDFFVFGCTVALRMSDLLKLRKSNLRMFNSQCYLSARSLKSNTDTLIKLPPYAIEIIMKYKKQNQLLPHFNKANLNKYIKRLLEQAGFVHPVQKLREKNGRVIELKRSDAKDMETFRFCDVASTHTMRRTAITTMLSLGIHEQVVRKISGHSPGSKDFYRYVTWAQSYQDEQTERMFEKLKGKEVNLPLINGSRQILKNSTS